MNQQLNHQPILSNPSQPVQSPQQRKVTRQYRLGLAAFALSGMLLANTVVFASVPVANAMSATANHLNYNGSSGIEVVAQKPTPMVTPTPPPSLAPFTVNSASIPVPLLRSQSFPLSGTAANGSIVRITSDGSIIGEGNVDENSMWAIPIHFDYPGDYTLKAWLIINDTVVAESAPIYISVNYIPTLTPTPYSQP